MYIWQGATSMSNIYVARQPIFDRHLNVYGYELLYRKSQNNYFEGTDDDQATAALLDNSFFFGLNELTDGTRGFINFSKKLLLDDTPFLLPPQNVVIEIIERVDITESVIEKCKTLKSMGYMIALDDFILSENIEKYEALLDYIDIIKVENFQNSLQYQTFFKKHKYKITFLAEKVETFEDFKNASTLGYKLFQGFFFSKPIMFKAKEIGSLNINLVMILEELYKPQPNHKNIVSIFERDLGLSYKLLRIVNSAYYGVRYEIKSIQQALSYVGTKELVRWVHLMLIKGVQNIDNQELVKTSLIRGKILSLLAKNSKKQKKEGDYFIAGIFASIDVLLHESMQNILNRLPLKNEVKNALLGQQK